MSSKKNRGHFSVAMLIAAVLVSLVAFGGLAQASSQPHRAAKHSATVKMATNARFGKILVNGKRMTLYHLTKEKHGKIVCTGGCATIWPPLLLKAGQKHPVAGAGVHGKLGTVKRPNGSLQVTYKGMPLYTYYLDKKPGQTKGEGIKGVWFVIKAKAGSSSGSSGSGSGW